MNQANAPVAANDLFSSFYRTQAIRYGVSSTWALGLAFVVDLRAALLWAGVTFALGLLRTALELRRMSGRAHAYDLEYVAASVVSNCGWAAAPVLAWSLGGSDGKVLAIAFLACGTIMVFSQMRGSFQRSLALCGPYILAAMAVFIAAIGAGEGVGVGFALAAITLGLVTQTLLGRGQDRIVAAYQREQDVLIGDLRAERKRLETELARRGRAEAKLGELVLVAQQTMQAKSSLLESIGSGSDSDGVDDTVHTALSSEASGLDELLARLGELVVAIQARDQVLERMVEALSHARQCAEAASKAKTQFLMLASHELRTPLNAIINYGELALEDLQTLDAEALARGDIERNLAAARHLFGLIDTILEYASLEDDRTARHRDPIDAAGLSQALLAGAQPWAKAKGLRLEVQLEDLPQVRADLARLRRILEIFIGNACKFTDAGAVTLSARATRRNGRPGVEFEVSDTGPGIDPAKREALFEPFSQLEGVTRARGGLGLGLAIAKRHAMCMGVDLDVASERGRGAAFSVFVPV